MSNEQSTFEIEHLEVFPVLEVDPWTLEPTSEWQQRVAAWERDVRTRVSSWENERSDWLRKRDQAAKHHVEQRSVLSQPYEKRLDNFIAQIYEEQQQIYEEEKRSIEQDNTIALQSITDAGKDAYEKRISKSYEEPNVRKRRLKSLRLSFLFSGATWSGFIAFVVFLGFGFCFKTEIGSGCVLLYPSLYRKRPVYQHAERAYKRGDYDTAFRLYSLLLSDGDSQVQYMLGSMYQNGLGVKSSDPAEAVRLYMLSAGLKNSDGELALSEAYRAGHGTLQDTDKAWWFLKQSAEHGNARAQYRLGWINENDYKNYGEAFTWYRTAAKQGFDEAQLSLGLMYEKGLYVRKDEKEAAQWYRRAAAQGNQYAKDGLTRLEKPVSSSSHHPIVRVSVPIRPKPSPTPKPAPNTKAYREQLVYQQAVQAFANRDDETAARLLSPLADAGDSSAQLRLAIILEDQYNSEHQMDPHPFCQQSLELYRLSANQGNYIAKCRIGNMYNRLNSASDQQEAMRWYRASAEQGFAPAQVSLGFMYELHQGRYESYDEQQDDREAVRWYRKAAHQGCAEGQWFLANSYQCGIGVPTNSKEAMKWYRLSANQGFEGAKEELKQLQKQAE